MSLPIAELLRRLRDGSREAFASSFPGHYLLQLEPGSPASSGQAFTRIPDAEPEREAAPTLLHPLQKAPDSQNPFAFMITVGRAANNDVVVAHPAVSGFHAYFRQLGDAWTIADANSSYGTTVDGSPLPAERGRSIQSGALVRLADCVSLEFLSGEDLYERLRDH